MRTYEVLFILSPQIPEEESTTLIHDFKRVAEGTGAKLTNEEAWGRRRLAYPIQKVFKAHYVLMNIEVGDETLNELEHAFKFNDAVLRHLTVKMTEAVTGPSPMMKEEKSRNVTEAPALAAAPEARDQPAPPAAE